MKKMLLVVPSLHQGGLEKVCALTARLLQPYFDVQIAIFDSRDVAYDVEGIPVFDLKLPSRPGKVGKAINVLRRGFKLRAIKKSRQIDIAYSFGPTANIANIASLGRAEKWLGIRSYMDMGNPRQIRLFAKHSDKLICCSEAIYKEIVEKYGCKHAYTLYNPFDIEEITRLAEAAKAQLPWKKGRILISMGREDVVKGFWHLLKIFAQVHRKLPDTKLVILGKGEFRQYRELADRLGVSEHVCFAGAKRNPYPYLKESELYLLTSYNEGFPNALVEAMALGTPVIATDCMTGPREILEDKYGILLPNMSPQPDMNADTIDEEEKVFASCVVKLLQDEKEMERYQKLSVERAGMYSSEAYVKFFLEQANEGAGGNAR